LNALAGGGEICVQRGERTNRLNRTGKRQKQRSPFLSGTYLGVCGKGTGSVAAAAVAAAAAAAATQARQLIILVFHELLTRQCVCECASLESG